MPPVQEWPQSAPGTLAAPRPASDARGTATQLFGGTLMLIHGSCHCGNLSFVLDWRGDADAIPARACTCSFCRKHAAVWTADPAAALEVHVRDPAAHSTYRFETATADFHVCARCGAVPLVTSRIEGRMHAVVNVNTFDDVDPSRLRRAEVSFDGEETASRLARRQRGWIGQVRFA